MATGALTEQAAEQLEQAAVVTRRIDGKAMGSFWVGIGVGAVVGFYFGYQYSKKKLRADILAEAEKEIEEVREHYRQKTIAAEAQDKPSVDEIVRERGYVTEEVPERPLRPPVPISPARHIVRDQLVTEDEQGRGRRSETAEKEKNEGWDFTTEVSLRNTKDIYIIHQDEYELNESGYAQTAYTYYTEDNVLVEDDDPQTILSNKEDLVGPEALHRFGYGSDDYNLVHVRNTKLELEIAINRIRGSWEKEVLGLTHDEPN